MDDRDKFIELILDDEKLRRSSRFSDSVYGDLPLLRRGSQIKPPETPQKIRQMKELAFSREAAWKTSAWLLYQQGCFMADYSDNCPYIGDFVKYYVTYRDLDTAQLRGFFTWRTAVRNGDFPNAPVPFLFLYAYELINNIGVDSPMDGFDRLLRLYRDCMESHKVVSRSVSRWLCDYVVYYGLDTAILRGFPEIAFDETVVTLMHWDERSDDELYAAMVGISAYQADKSKYVLTEPDKFRTAAVRLFREMSAYHAKKCKNSLCTRLFGRVTEMECHLFADAVFYDRDSSKNADVQLSEIHSYTCRNGVWRCSKIYGNRGKNGKLGDILKALDCVMRERYGFTYKLQMPKIQKNTADLIRCVLDGMDEELRRAEAAKIEIDLSALSGIRAESEETRDKLLTEEDLADFDDAPEPEPAADESAEPENSVLQPAESAFLSALLCGGDWSGTARKFGCIPSVLADSVNERLFDMFGDTVIDFSADVPEIIEDYAEDVRKIIENGGSL